MVGGETVRQDNPSLTVRDENWQQQPLRIIASRTNTFDHTLKIFDKNHPLFFKDDSPSSWDSLLNKLGQQGVMTLLIEGGGELAARAIQAKVVHKVFFMISPKILGGRDSRSVVAGENPEQLSEAITLIERKIDTFGQDIMISGYL
jgi:diaminohydroxyphosphoribosylaminopyrimidine deaminase/5-amino-6-(5-phosphoribosylamino)uracil reductase